MIYARTVGMKHWVCPQCGHFNRSRVNATDGYRVKCRDANCQHVYIVGEVFYDTVPGFKLPPVDRIMPVEMSKELWHSGQPVNRLVPASDTVEPGEFPAT